VLEILKIFAGFLGVLKAWLEYRAQKLKASTAPPVEASPKETPTRD
jgi:hypothetical protein